MQWLEYFGYEQEERFHPLPTTHTLFLSQIYFSHKQVKGGMQEAAIDFDTVPLCSCVGDTRQVQSIVD
eukprot:10441821-Ditylum_brightwellii.AAC.1